MSKSKELQELKDKLRYTEEELEKSCIQLEIMKKQAQLEMNKRELNRLTITHGVHIIN